MEKRPLITNRYIPIQTLIYSAALSTPLSFVHSSKKGNSPLLATMTNYRPVSLTCVPCKILEHIVWSICSDIMAHRLLSDKQQVVCKSCNRTGFGRIYGNYRSGPGRIYGIQRKITIFRYRDLAPLPYCKAHLSLKIKLFARK